MTNWLHRVTVGCAFVLLTSLGLAQMPFPGEILPLSQKQGFALASADFNADKLPDVAFYTIDGALEIYLQTTRGTFELRDSYTPTGRRAGGPLAVLEAADFNGDGLPDILIVESATNPLAGYFPGVGDGRFGTFVTIAITGRLTNLTWGDLNGDRFPDLAIIDGRGLTTHYGTAGGDFQLTDTLPLPGNVVRIYDVNHDGAG